MLRNEMFLVISLITASILQPPCGKLRDGIYLAKHPPENIALDYRLTIRKEKYIIQRKGVENEEGTFVRVGKCSFRLQPLKTEGRDSNELSRLLYKSFGEPIFEIIRTDKDTTFFRHTYSGNLHITKDEGYFLKLR